MRPPTAQLGAPRPPWRAFLMMQDRPGVRHLLHQADWISGKLSGRFDRSDWNNALKTGYDPVAARWPDWIERTGADLAKLPVVLEPGRRHWSGQRRGRRPRHTGVSDCPCRNDGRLRFVSRDRRLGGGRRRDRARIDAGRQASVRPPNLRPGVRNLQPSDWLDVACWRRLEYRRQGHRAVLSARSSCAAFRGHEAGEPNGTELLSASESPANASRSTIPKLPPRLEPRPKDDATFLQAILEGVAEVEALAYRKLAELGAPPLRSVRTVGGGATNSAWTKIRERKLAAPFKFAESQDACAGVARLALQSLRNSG